MRQLSFQEVQKESLAVLLYIKEICLKHNIPMYLGYGTALGAVRHGGFIPWDDDIDILMYRKDYLKLRTIINNEQGRYKVADIEVDKDYVLVMPKVYDTQTTSVWPVVNYPFAYGAWVDVFFLDNAPDNKSKRANMFRKLDFLQRCYNYSLYKMKGSSVIKSLIGRIAKLFGPRYFVKKLWEISDTYNNESCHNVNVSIFDRLNKREKYLWPKDMIGKGTPMLFENEEFMVPEKIDDYLRNRFGDYMQLPPEGKRVSNHSLQLYYLNEG